MGLKGVFPPVFVSLPDLKYLFINRNPELTGVIPKAIILQCDRIMYHGCQPRWDRKLGKENKHYMAGPFVCGASFASEDIAILLSARADLGIVDDMVQDPPGKGDPRYSMYESHGPEWVAWQETWLQGLRSIIRELQAQV